MQANPAASSGAGRNPDSSTDLQTHGLNLRTGQPVGLLTVAGEVARIVPTAI